jgi:hypothetical protein
MYRQSLRKVRLFTSSSKRNSSFVAGKDNKSVRIPSLFLCTTFTFLTPPFHHIFFISFTTFHSDILHLLLLLFAGLRVRQPRSTLGFSGQYVWFLVRCKCCCCPRSPFRSFGSMTDPYSFLPFTFIVVLLPGLLPPRHVAARRRVSLGRHVVWLRSTRRG